MVRKSLYFYKGAILFNSQKRKNMNWREDKPTDKQLRAIINIRNGWEITDKKYRKKPKTKGEACDMIGELVEMVKSIKQNTIHFSDDYSLYRQEMGDMAGDPFFFGQN